MAVSVDFESYYSSKLKYSLRSMLTETYVRHELFRPYMLAVCDGTTSWAGDPKNFNWNALEGQILISHNKSFDYQVWLEMARRNWCPKPNFKEYHCTSNLTSYLCNRRALDDAVEFLYNIKLDKSARAEADGKNWPQDFSEVEQAAMLKYAPTDAYWCWKLWADHSDKWPVLERRLSNQTIEQGIRGIQINTVLLNDYIIQTHEAKTNTENLIPWIKDADDESWDEFNTKPTSLKCIAEACRRAGIPIPPVKSHEGEEAFAEWEETYAEKYPWISALSSWRSLNKLYKTFLLMKERVRPDGSMPFALKYMGAHTGRWSGDGKLNLQNPRKKALLVNASGVMETNEIKIDAAFSEKKKTKSFPDWVKYAIDFRALIIPRPGKIMVQCDLAQIEPRVLAWLTKNTALMDAIRDGHSLYESFARSNMGYVGPKLDKDSDYYKLTKIQVLGLGYQAAWKKFIKIAQMGGIDITENDSEFIETVHPITGEIKKESGYGLNSKKIVAEFRAKNPRIVALWQQLDSAFKSSVGSDFRMKLPSGRYMTYRNVKASVKITPDENGKPIRTTEFTAESDLHRSAYYGGKICENLVQATARDIFGEHLIALEDAGHTVLYSSHDEAVCECAPGVTAHDIEKIMSQTPSWMPGLPVAAEAKEVAYYQK